MTRISIATSLFFLSAAGDYCAVTMKDGQPLGETKDIGGIKTYISSPRNQQTDTAILFLTDIYGLPSNDSKLLGDSMAAAGYFVVMPDIMANDIPTDKGIFDYVSWFLRHPVSVADDIVDKTIKYMKSEMGIKKIGVVGYCFGGRYAVRVMKEGKGVDAGFIAHPTMLESGELEAAAGPLSIAAAETDALFNVNKRREAEDILLKKKTPYQLTLYSGVQHGFSVRANLQDKKERMGKEGAFLQAIRWFDEWVKN